MVRYSAISILAVLLGLLSSCGGAKLSLADEQMERGEYFAAAATYRKVYNKLKRKEDRPQRGEIAYKMGLCYDKLSMSSRAAVAFNNAIRFGVADSSLYLLLGRSLQSDGKYRQAMDAYTIYLQHSPESKEAEIGISGCRIAMVTKWRVHGFSTQVGRISLRCITTEVTTGFISPHLLPKTKGNQKAKSPD